MSDDERIDMMDADADGMMMGESDEDDMDDDEMEKGQTSGSTKPMTQAEKRAHHNALERKRRDHIKDSFTSLRDSVPSLQGEKSSRAQILKKAADYITYIRRKNSSHQHDIEDLKRQNNVLESQIRGIERARMTGSFSSATATVSGMNTLEVTIENELSEEDHSHSPVEVPTSTSIPVNGGSKKIKVLAVGGNQK